MKKKILSFVLAICLIVPVTMFNGCGKNPAEESNKGQEYVGKYVVAEYTYADYYDYDFENQEDILVPGDTITKEQYEANPGNYENLDCDGWFDKEIELKSNYCFIDTQSDVQISINGKWELKNNTIILYIDGEEYFNLIINVDNTLTLNANESETLKFVKVK